MCESVYKSRKHAFTLYYKNNYSSQKELFQPCHQKQDTRENESASALLQTYTHAGTCLAHSKAYTLRHARVTFAEAR